MAGWEVASSRILERLRRELDPLEYGFQVDELMIRSVGLSEDLEEEAFVRMRRHFQGVGDHLRGSRQ